MSQRYLRHHHRTWHDAFMAISRKLLSDGEHVVLSVRTHAKALIWPVVLFILVVTSVLTVALRQPDNLSLIHI